MEMPNRSAEATTLVYARVAGFALLLGIIVSVLNIYFVDAKLIVPGNNAATANAIMANGFLFRLGIAAVIIIYASVVILSAALYITLKPVDKNLALLAMLLRLGEAILGGVTVLMSFIVLLLLNGKGYSAGIDTEQVQAWVGLFLTLRTAWLDVVLIFVGLGGTVFCYLFLKSKYVPRILAAWGLFTYSSMLILSFVSILFPTHSEMFETVLYGLGTLFEVLFGFWLLLKGINLQQRNNHAPVSPTTPPVS